MSTSSGKLIVISGPSGAGKSTLLARLLEVEGHRLSPSVSATTRAPRPGEQEGRDYHFLSLEEFERRRRQGDFLECVEVYPGTWYGTLKSAVAPSLAAGKSVVLEIDVQGMRSVLREHPEALTIFVRPGSLEDDASLKELQRRLRLRQTETEASIQKRLETAGRELAAADEYQHQVVNDDLDQALSQIRAILDSCGE